MPKFLGFSWGKNNSEEPPKKPLPSFSAPIEDDGAVNIEATTSGQFTSAYIDFDAGFTNDAELITRYRSMSGHPEIRQAVTEICNEMVVMEDEEEVVELNLDELEDLPDNIKEKFDDAFDRILDLMEFKTQGYHIVETWYVDSRLYYHAVVDPQKMKDGIQEIRYVDPRKIKKIREVTRTPVTQGLAQTQVITPVSEYYVYNERGFGAATQPGYAVGGSSTITGIKIAPEAIAYAPSGLTDASGRAVIGYLHPAIKPLNQLRAMEDAAVIYRLTRAPERRVFYIDVGNLPKPKAEQYLREMATRHKNRLTYDSTTGEIRDERKYMTTYEDYWLPRRGEGKGTEISTLQGGQNLGQMDDVYYFQKKLYRSLQVPLGRLDPEHAYQGLGPSQNEISQEEVNFSRFIERLRAGFNVLFLTLLGKQLILTNVLKAEDWEEIRPKIRFKYARDVMFAELKEGQVRNLRLEGVTAAMPFVGRFFSNEYVRRAILRQSDEDMRREDKLIQKEAANPQFQMVDPESGSLIPNAMTAAPPLLSGPDTGPPAVDPRGQAPDPKKDKKPAGKPKPKPGKTK